MDFRRVTKLGAACCVAFLFAGVLQAGTVTLLPDPGTAPALRFELTGKIPAGARIDGATLTVERLNRVSERALELHRRLPEGELAALPSAIQVVQAPGPYTWGSTEQMVADLQAWLETPAENLGWSLDGDPAGASVRPRLAVSFTTVEQAAALPAVSLWGPVFLGFILAALVNRLRK